MISIFIIIAFIGHPAILNIWPEIYQVHGTVRNTVNEAVADAQIEVVHDNRKSIVRVGGDGRFSLSLAKGEYELHVTKNRFCEIYMTLTLRGNENDKPLDISLLDCSDCADASIDFAERPVEAGVPPPKPLDMNALAFEYHEEQLEPSRQGRSAKSILFGRRIDREGFIEYTGLDCPGERRLAILQYGVGAITATHLLLTKSSRTIRGEGEVTVVDWRGVARGTTVEVNLRSKEPTAVMIK